MLFLYSRNIVAIVFATSKRKFVTSTIPLEIATVLYIVGNTHLQVFIHGDVVLYYQIIINY